jgi:UDP-3-O-[3-hydroxymyristoyl] glucosamine N-acyltransferase
MKLSVLRNAGPGCITYYSGNNIQDVSHLFDCVLYCNLNFSPVLENVKIKNVVDPQLEFYKLSAEYREDYLEQEKMEFMRGSWVHVDAKIDSSAHIYPGCTIGNCEIGKNVVIHPNCVVFSKTKVGENTSIDSNCSIGSSGMMWVWDGDERVFLEQLGNVIIGKNCRIGSNTCIVRGSANESTTIGDAACLAPSCAIGHGTLIGGRAHLANNVSTGGGSQIAEKSFLGSGSVVAPGVNISAKNVIVGAGAVIVNDILVSGVYAGVPARKIVSEKSKLRGVPSTRNL